MRRIFASSAAAILILVSPGICSSARAAEAWTAHARPDPPAVQISKTARDGRTIFLGGCNKLLGAGLTGTFSAYRGNALQKIDDETEPVTFEVTGKAGAERFAGGLHYMKGEDSWGITGLLTPAFVEAFARGDTLTIRNGSEKDVFSFELRGSSKAAAIMQRVCGFTSASSRPVASSWSAMSTTALSITGDIRISEKEVRFQNGATLQLAPTGRPGIFRIAKPANPVLKNGNVLCGRVAPTFVAFGLDEEAGSLGRSSNLYLKIYNGSEVPPESDAVGMDARAKGFCALYNYTR